MTERPGAGPPESPLMSGSASKCGRATRSSWPPTTSGRAGAGDPRCSVFLIEPRVARVMDDLRDRILHEFGRVAPPGLRPRLRRRP
jgi:hypothetical protein